MNGNGKVTFGAYKAGEGCSGSGICQTNPPASGDAVSVVFSYAKNNPSKLTMSFKLSDLKKKQPAQVKNFVNGQPLRFDAPYSLSDSMFSQLGVPKGAMITPQSASRVSVRGDMVVVDTTIQLPRAEGNLSFTGDEDHWQDFR